MRKYASWPPLVRVSLRYGLVSGVLGFLILVVLYYTGHHPFLILVFFDYRIILFAIVFVFALREVRDYYQGGILHFWQGMIGCLMITLFFSAIASGALYLFASAVPQFVTSYIDLSMVQVKAFTPEDIERIGKDVYEASIKSLQAADASFLASRYFAQSLIISFFISIIISVILRRQPVLIDDGKSN